MKPFRCRHCRKVIGHTDGCRLVVPGCFTLYRCITLECTCGRLVVWKPVGQAIAAQQAPCYTEPKST